MKKISLYSLFLIVLLSSCAKNEKKILVLNKGRATINIDNKTVDVKEGSGNESNDMFYDSKSTVSIKVKTTEKEFIADAPENGYYILNAKNDTIIGGIQKFTKAAAGDSTYYSQEMVKKRIDSLNDLIENKKVDPKAFYILPYSMMQITKNPNAIIIAPFHNKSTIDQPADGSEPEVYRFYTVNEIRGQIKNLIEFTKPKKKEEDKK